MPKSPDSLPSLDDIGTLNSEDVLHSQWPDGVVAGASYEVLRDDKGRNGVAWLRIMVSQADGDGHVMAQDWEGIPIAIPNPSRACVYAPAPVVGTIAGPARRCSGWPRRSVWIRSSTAQRHRWCRRQNRRGETAQRHRVLTGLSRGRVACPTKPAPGTWVPPARLRPFSTASEYSERAVVEGLRRMVRGRE